MAAVRERIYTEAPYTQAVGMFERRLGLAPGVTHGKCELTLVAPATGRNEIARVVSATTERLPGAANYQSQYRIRWAAGRTAVGFPTPSFAGTLTLGAGEDYGECALELVGQYEPPGGPAGGVFDEIIGRRIAHATLSTLLDEVGRHLHHEHQRVESEKRSTQV